MADSLPRDVKIRVNMDEDMKLITEKYFDFLPENVNREAELKALVKNLCKQ